MPKDQEGDATVPLNSRDKDTLLGHCARAIDYTLGRFGAHGLPLDGLGRLGRRHASRRREGRGESVWLGFFLHGILVDIAPLFEAKGDAKRARALSRARREACARRWRECWRGDRYLRAFADDGRELSPMSAMTASLADAVRRRRRRRAGARRSRTRWRCSARPTACCSSRRPSTNIPIPIPGRSAEYPPGVRENGGQYSHGVSWFVDALAQLGVEAKAAGDEAAARGAVRARPSTPGWRSRRSRSSERRSEADIYGLPPHQQPADVYEGEGYEGRGGWAWYTGAAARMLSAAYAMLGLEFENGELHLRADAFDPKGDLRLESVSYRGEDYFARRTR